MRILKLGFRLLFLKSLYDNVSEAWIPELPVLCELSQIDIIVVATELFLGGEALEGLLVFNEVVIFDISPFFIDISLIKIILIKGHKWRL